MTNITKLEFDALDISRNNYLSWILDAEIHLDAMNLGHTIKEGNSSFFSLYIFFNFKLIFIYSPYFIFLVFI